MITYILTDKRRSCGWSTIVMDICVNKNTIEKHREKEKRLQNYLNLISPRERKRVIEIQTKSETFTKEEIEEIRGIK